MNEEFTWKDVKRLVEIADKLIAMPQGWSTEEEYYKKVLKIYRNGKF